MPHRPEATSSELAPTGERSNISAERRPQVRGLLIVDDHEVVRWGLRSLIQAHSRHANESMRIFEAPTLASALELFAAHQADIRLVFLDLGLPDTTGLSGLAAFRAQFPSASMVVISGDSNTATVESAMAMGALAYLKKTGDLAEVIGYLQNQGLMTINNAAVNLPWDSTTLFDKGQGLTERQTQILEWILEGKSNREIGELAFLAKGTVKNHVTTLLLHFGVKSRAQLISALR
ncbi:hypothetical protein LPB72_21110 [Hydrogenophaga crassostreae]|uniref:DNA-binding response regulator n=1 Tax=Hydrogenophaga crassostreae TaxID=1763535 RepID=A0A167GIE4_9BURK|nr:response regulator transcription factor [Hydrogenophaga crassostreae]AOW15036.1 hypothetical protein LPB072_21725 [Hydrogenophaga crassostreae]OAD39488.1 hypothetical protein LPB72_21110 [Hydrogenophaga crassostreae]